MIFFETVNTRTFSIIKSDFRNEIELDIAKKNAIKVVKKFIVDSINKIESVQERNLIINFFKLILKSIQEAINNKGRTNFFEEHKFTHQENEFLKNIFSECKKELEIICLHRNTIFRDRKFSLFGTNYTESAQEIIQFLKNFERALHVNNRNNNEIQFILTNVIVQTFLH